MSPVMSVRLPTNSVSSSSLYLETLHCVCKPQFSHTALLRDSQELSSVTNSPVNNDVPAPVKCWLTDFWVKRSGLPASHSRTTVGFFGDTLRWNAFLSLSSLWTREVPTGSQQVQGCRGARPPANCEAALCTVQDVPWNSSERQNRAHTEAVLPSDPSPAYALPRIVCCVFPMATTFPGNSTAVKMEGSWALFGLELALKTQFAHRYSFITLNMAGSLPAMSHQFAIPLWSKFKGPEPLNILHMSASTWWFDYRCDPFKPIHVEHYYNLTVFTLYSFIIQL